MLIPAPPEAIRRQLFVAVFVAALLATLSGCATKQTMSGRDEVEEAPPALPAVVPDPDLEPVAAEPETVIAEELEALARTGSWDQPRTEIIEVAPVPQPIPEPVAEPPRYDFPVVMNPQVEAYLELFQGKQRTYFGRWLARAGRYRDIICQELEAAGLPKDLLYLAMIESGFSQRAYSRSRAVGLWQFMSGTGRQYGLSITRYVDERRNAVKSTRAAVAYLQDLYEEFGDWYLAVAAYNGGPGTIRKAMRRTKSDDFWKVAQKRHLKMETKRYVPKLIAAIIIAKEPEKYGFTDIVAEKPMTFDTLEVGPGLSLDAVALLSGSDRKEIKRLNLELRTSKTPLDRERYAVKIPAGTKGLAERNLPRLHSVASTDYKTHIIEKNDTLASVCRRYNINTTTLLKVNNLKSSRLIAGSRLRIPYTTIDYRILPEGMDARTLAADDLLLHTVKRGETVSKIANRYRVPAELIVAWNNLRSIHKITAGQQLALYLNSTSPTEAEEVRTAGDSTAAVVLSKASKHPVRSSGSPTRYRLYLVRNGDSLWTISRRFNTSPEQIRRWNNLKSNLIHPGSQLKIRDV